jgi:hypothetical protein
LLCANNVKNGSKMLMRGSGTSYFQIPFKTREILAQSCEWETKIRDCAGHWPRVDFPHSGRLCLARSCTQVHVWDIGTLIRPARGDFGIFWLLCDPVRIVWGSISSFALESPSGVAFWKTSRSSPLIRGGHKVRPPRLKPARSWDSLRGAEAPLFHVTARFRGLRRCESLPYVQYVLSRLRYWMASAMCLGSTEAVSSMSAMVRATFRMRS